MMDNINVGIVGNGFVGNAVYQNLRDKVKTKIFDVDKNRCLNPLEEVIQQDFIFVCLPTPMRMDGSCDLSILDKFFEELPDNLTGTFVIKSTVPVGTTKKYTERHNVIHNPEFLTARNAVVDFANAERTVIGGNQYATRDAANFYWRYFHETPVITMSSDESEAVKYFSNTFLAYKVAYFNKIYDMCEKVGMDYKNVVEGVTADSRIGTSHTRVPGIDGDRGFGGTCFPKDINALIHLASKLGIDSNIFSEINLLTSKSALKTGYPNCLAT